MSEEKEKFLLKDHLFNKEKVSLISGLIKVVYPKLDAGQFEKEILAKFPELELKKRITWIGENIKKQLPENYTESLDILLSSLKNKTIDEDFIFTSYSDFVEKNGCTEKHLKKSLSALGEFTKFCSAEFAIRRFINDFPEQTFAKMQYWSASKNVHQRRLVSEGLRPKLPWAQSINFDYKKSTKVLDNLFYDTERYVTRSVANHLNDISKIDINFVLDKLGKWKSSKKQDDSEMNYIIQHSLRTSIKRGNFKTLIFLGYKPNPDIKVENLILKKENIALGDKLEFSFEIFAKNHENLIIDYKIIYPNPSNRHSEKVFKIKKTEMLQNEIKKIKKKHAFKQMTTKKLYSGNYMLEIQINGNMLASTNFNLKV